MEQFQINAVTFIKAIRMSGSKVLIYMYITYTYTHVYFLRCWSINRFCRFLVFRAIGNHWHVGFVIWLSLAPPEYWLEVGARKY